jgi:DNA-binding NarL/FixJ family response regulator
VQRPIRVVLVEDNDIFRETLELLFGLRSEIEVVASLGSGLDAPNICAQLQPDVVVMDYRMPGLDGAQTTRAVLAAAPRVRVVCLSASVSRGEVERIREAGAVACLTKDEDLEQIVAVVCEAAG